MMLDLAEAGICVYSPHTAFDSSEGGINEMTLAAYGIKETSALVEKVGIPGAGRYGKLSSEKSLKELISLSKEHYGLEQIKVVGDQGKKIKKIGVACGSGGDFFSAAKAKGVDLLITGEASFHTCLAAKAYDISLILTGHYASERFAVEKLAELVVGKFSDLEVITSKADVSPLNWA